MTLWRWFFPKKQEKDNNLEQQESDDEAEDTVDVLPPKPVQQESESDWGMGKYPLYNEAATTHTLTEMEDENSDDSSFNSNTVPQTLSSLLTTKAFRKSVSTSNLQRMNSKSVVIDFNHFAAPSRLLSYKTNPFNEFHMLHGHKDIVRQVLSLHSEYSTQTTTWIASSGDDDNIIIWDWFYARKIHVLEGHRSPVTCMCLLPNMTLLSGSCDKTIKMWDLSDGKCIKTLHEHSKGVKRLCILDEKRFCSGGNDDKLCIWSFEGELLDVIERVEDENIHEILVLPNNNIVTASDNKSLRMFNTFTVLHFGSIRCVQYKIHDRNGTQTRVSHRLCAVLGIFKWYVEPFSSILTPHAMFEHADSYFASASLDGSIIIWDTVKLAMVKKLEQHKTDKTLTKIHDMLVINKNFLAVAVHNGFCIYDWESNKIVMQEKQAHNAACRKLIALHQGNVIVSCSDDCKLRVWYTQHRFTEKYGTPQAPSVSTPVKTPTTTTTSEKKTDEILSPKFIGELEVHVKSINDLLYLSDYHFASCSADGTVLIWKDGRIERRLRLVLASLYNSYGFRAKDVLKHTMTRLNTAQLRSLHRVTSNADSMDTDADENV